MRDTHCGVTFEPAHRPPSITRSAGTIIAWFTPFNQATFNANDIDLGSSGITILPDTAASTTHPHLAVSTGKVAILHLLDIAAIDAQNPIRMGKFNSSTNNDVHEVIPVPPPNTTLLDGGNYGNIAFWAAWPNTGNLYTTGQNFPLSQFSISNGVISAPQLAKSANSFPPRGDIPVVSANGTTNGVVWILGPSHLVHERPRDSRRLRCHQCGRLTV